MTDEELIKDPFDEPIEITDDEALVFNDTYFAAARNAISIEGMEYSFLKPPYMNFDDHIKTKKKLKKSKRYYVRVAYNTKVGKKTVKSKIEASGSVY